jgi:type IV pilus assembly protein PilM
MNWKLNFNFARFTGGYGPIGVDIGARGVKAVQLALNGDRRILHAATVLPLPAVTMGKEPAARDAAEGELFNAIAQRLSDQLIRQGFHGRELVLAAPAHRLEADLLELPPRSSGAPLDELARVEIGRSGGMASTSFEMASWDLPQPARGGNSTAVMAIALRHKDADRMLDAFTRHRFTCRAIDVDAAALARAAAASFKPNEMSGVLDLGWANSRLVLVYNGTIVYRRMLADVSLSVLHQAVTSRLELAEDAADYALATLGAATTEEATDIDPAEVSRLRALVTRYVDALVTELKASFSFALHRYPELPLKRLLLAGGGARVAGLASTLSQRLSTDVQVWTPAASVDCSGQSSSRSMDPALMAAMGLALYEQGDDGGNH